MTSILGLTQLLLIGLILIYEFEKKSASVFLWATLLVMFGVMHCLTSFMGDNIYPDRVLNETGLFVLLFCFLYLLCRVPLSIILCNDTVIPDYSTLQSNLNKDRMRDGVLLSILIAIILAKLLPLAFYCGGFFNTSWGRNRSFSASLSYVNKMQLINVLYYCFAGCIAIFCIKRKRTYFIVVSFLVLFDVLVTKNRIEILPFLCSLLTMYLCKTNKLTLKSIVVSCLCGVFVIYLVYGLRVFRHYGSMRVFLENATLCDFWGRINYFLKTNNGELGLLRNLYYFINNNNNFPNFGKMHTYLRMLFVYVPTAWSGGIKPSDFAISMGAAIGMAPGGSTHPTLFGDCYANAGMWGISLGIFWAMYVSFIDRLIQHRKTSSFKVLAFILNAVVFVIMGRGSVYNGFIFVAYGLPIIIFCEWCMCKFRVVL